MRRGSSRVPGAAGGMTLLEVLVALAIASIVFASVFLLFRTTAATAVRQRDREQTTYAPAELVAAMQADIAGLMPDGLDEDCKLTLKTGKADGDRESSELSCCIWRSDGPLNDEFQTGAERISWRLEAGGTRQARIARTASVLAGPRSTVSATNYYLPGAGLFRLRLHDGREWRDAWPPPGSDEKNRPRPAALRIELALQGDLAVTNWTTDFLVPIGLRATSRVERLSAPAAPVPRAGP